MSVEHTQCGLVFENFRLEHEDERHSIAVRSGAQDWDFHNCGRFEGLDYDVVQRVVQLSWAFEPTDLNEHHSGCVLKFTRVSGFLCEPHDLALPMVEDQTVHEMGLSVFGKASASDDRWAYPSGTEHAAFRIVFLGGSALEVLAESVRLVPQPGE